MPDTGPNWNIPYPLGSDRPDDPAQSQARAQKIHADLTQVDGTQFSPKRHGLLGWSTPIDAVNGFQIITQGKLCLVRVPVVRAGTVGWINMNLATGASGLVAGQNLGGIYSVTTGDLLRSTKDLSVIWPGAGNKDCQLTTPLDLPVGDVWVAFLCNGTTAPQVARSSISAALPNLNLPLAESRTVVSTASFTALPLTVPAFTANTFLWFLGLKE